jgi:hypothetical protein
VQGRKKERVEEINKEAVTERKKYKHENTKKNNEGIRK